MKLRIANDKVQLAELVSGYLAELLTNKEADVIINGEKITGTIRRIHLENPEDDFMLIEVDEKERKIPLMDDTKADIGTEVILLLTKSHSTYIELL